MTKQEKLAKLMTNVTGSLQALFDAIEGDDFMNELLIAGIQTTGALPCSLDEFVCEWQTATNNVQLDKLALYNCWRKSAKFYGTMSSREKASIDGAIDLGHYDIVFEDGSIINTHIKISMGQPNITYSVLIANQEPAFAECETACKYLWENHAKIGYGL